MAKKAKRGRPKGSKNKVQEAWDKSQAKEFVVTTATPHGLEVGDVITFSDNSKPAPTRLDVLMSEFETEMQRVISKLKAVF